MATSGNSPGAHAHARDIELADVGHAEDHDAGGSGDEHAHGVGLLSSTPRRSHHEHDRPAGAKPLFHGGNNCCTRRLTQCGRFVGHPLRGVACVGFTVVLIAVLRITVWRTVPPQYTFRAVDMSSGAMASQCASELALIDSIRAQVDATPDAIIDLGNALDDRLTNLASTAYFLAQVHPDAAFRQAATSCYLDASAKSTSLGLDHGLYEAYAAVDTSALEGDTLRFVTKSVEAFQRQGVDKSDADRARLTTLSAEIDSIGEQYESGVINDVRTVSVDLNLSPDAAEGLPDDFVAAHTDPATNVLTITTDYPDYQPTMKYAVNETLRQQLKFEFMNRGYPDNVQHLQDLLSKRYEYAQLLGFDDYDALYQQNKMMKTPADVRAFLTDVEGLVGDRAAAEEERILTIKRRDHPGATTLESYDASYYMNLANEEFYGVDSREVRQYFTYDKVRDGILATTADMFSLRFEMRDDVQKWHPDVEVIDVYSLDPDLQRTGFLPQPLATDETTQADATGGYLLGRFYLDMHPRDGKYKHAASFPMVGGMEGVHLTQTGLACNFPKDGPMEHNQVVTFYHEFGHNLHTIIGGVGQTYAMFSGTATEWDFVEAPSQMLEEWAWRYDSLSQFATNADGEVIPQSLVHQMAEAEDFGVGINTKQQLFYAEISFQYYTSDPATLDTTAKLVELQAQLSPYPYIAGTHFNANFGHLVGYAGGYYTYQLSLSCAKDIYSRFEDPSLSRAVVALEYSHKVLNPGGSKDAADLMEDFLGRPYNLDAYSAWLRGDAP